MLGLFGPSINFNLNKYPGHNLQNYGFIQIKL